MALRFRVAFLILLALVSGFVMENLKVSVNYMLDICPSIPGYFSMSPEERLAALEDATAYVPFDYYYNHKTPSFLFHMDHSGLERLKWGIAIFFVALFMMINARVLRLLTGQRSYELLTYRLYGLFFFLSLGVYLLGRFIGDPQMAYAVSRKITHGLQSLIPLMLIYPGTWIATKLKEQNQYEKPE